MGSIRRGVARQARRHSGYVPNLAGQIPASVAVQGHGRLFEIRRRDRRAATDRERGGPVRVLQGVRDQGDADRLRCGAHVRGEGGDCKGCAREFIFMFTRAIRLTSCFVFVQVAYAKMAAKRAAAALR